MEPLFKSYLLKVMTMSLSNATLTACSTCSRASRNKVVPMIDDSVIDYKIHKVTYKKSGRKKIQHYL